MQPEHQISLAIERSCARRDQAERQLRSLRGVAHHGPLAELDSLLAYELGLEARLNEILKRTAATV